MTMTLNSYTHVCYCTFIVISMKLQKLYKFTYLYFHRNVNETNEAMTLTVLAPKPAKRKLGRALADGSSTPPVAGRSSTPSDEALLRMASAAPAIPAGKTAQRDAAAKAKASVPAHLAVLPAEIAPPDTPAAKKQRRTPTSSVNG